MQAEHGQAEGKRPGRIRLAPYWLGVLACLIVLGIYIATIVLLGTETGKRTTAPPWYAWVRYPPTKTRLQAIFLVFPVIVYGGWMLFVRRMVARKLSDLIVLPVAVLAVLAMNVTTAMMDGGADAIWKPFGFYLMGSEFYGDVPAVRAAGISTFLRGYVHNLYHYSIHTRTHPPGPVLVLYFVSCLFGSGPAAASWAADVITATAVVPFFLLARRLIGWQVACVAVGLYVVTPSLVIYGATTMDGVTLVALLWGIYFLLRAIDRPGIFSGVLAGIAITAGLMMSYVVVCVLALGAVFGVLDIFGSRNAPHPNPLPGLPGRGEKKVDLGLIGKPGMGEKILRLAWCAGISVLVPVLWFAGLYAVTGFNLVKCFEGSRYYDHYAMRTFSISFHRYLDISFSNLFGFLIGVGFPVVLLWWRQVARSTKSAGDRFSAAGLICVLVFSFARLFTHETERIWLFFIPPALIGAASWIARVDGRSNRLREWAMGLMFAQAWVFQLLLFTLW